VRSSTPEHWQKFWEEADTIDLDDVYGTDGRMVREITGLLDPGKTGSLAGKRILEVGAGTGRDAVALASAGAEVLTLDYVSGSLSLTMLAAERNAVTVAPICGDGLASPFADNTFDVVFHQGLLEHFPDPLPLLRDNIRILKPGGCVVIDVPQTFHYYTLGKQFLIAIDRWFAGWETQFTIAQLEKLMQDENLAIVRSYGDWMVPGLWYRAVRKILMTRLGLKLPMHPQNIPPFGYLGEAWRGFFGKSRLSLYTTPTIGVIARKAGSEPEA